MTLDEIFAFEAAHSVTVGRSVVSAEGFKRRRAKPAKPAKTVRPSRAAKKRRGAKIAAA